MITVRLRIDPPSVWRVELTQPTLFPLSTDSLLAQVEPLAIRNHLRTRLDTELDQIQREAQLRRIGRDLHDQAASISPETVDAVAAVLMKLEVATDYGELVDEGFGQAMRAEASVRHIRRELTFD
jgi:hypothetical protein